MFWTLQHAIHLTTTRPRYFMRVSEFFLSSDKILVNSRRGNRPMWSETLRRQHPLQFFRTSFSDFYSIKNWFLVLFFSVILLTEKRRENFFSFSLKENLFLFFLTSLPLTDSVSFGTKFGTFPSNFGPFFWRKNWSPLKILRLQIKGKWANIFAWNIFNCIFHIVSVLDR